MPPITRPSRSTATGHAAHIEAIITSKAAAALRSKNETASLFPGCCFLVTGAAGSGKSVMIEGIIDKLKATLHGGGAQENTTAAPPTVHATFADLLSIATSSATSISSVRLTVRAVDAGRALQHVFLNNSTMLHSEILGRLDGCGEESVVFDEVVTLGEKTSNNKTAATSSSSSASPETSLHVNIAVWDHFDLFFGKDGGTASASSAKPKNGGDTSTETTTIGGHGVELVPNYEDELKRVEAAGIAGMLRGSGGVSSSSVGNQLGNIAFESDTASSDDKNKTRAGQIQPFAAPPELLTHFLSIASKIGGKSLDFWTLEPRFVDDKKKAKAGEKEGGASSHGKSPSTTRTVNFLFAVASADAIVDPIVRDGPAFDYIYELLTPTEEERRNIIARKMISVMGRGGGKTDDASSSVPLARYIAAAAAAKLGGCSAEYVAMVGEYFVAKLQQQQSNNVSLSASPVASEKDVYQQLASSADAAAILSSTPDTENGKTAALLSALNLQIGNDLAIFDGLWSGSQTANNGTSPSSSTAADSSDRRSQVGYTDVQKVMWSDIAGLADVKKQLQRLVLSVKHKDVYKQNGVEPSIGAVLYGPPGTGKTMLAKAMATEMLASFVYLDLPELINGAIGESEKILKEFFAVAKERSPCIMFIDEVQSAFSKRYDNARGGNNAAHDARLVSALLGLLDEVRRNFFEYPIVFIGATNWIEVIDEAILRPGRLDTHIYVGPPDADAREALITHYVKQQWSAWVPAFYDEEQSSGSALSTKLFVSILIAALIQATEGMSGAEVKNGLNEFAMRLFVGDAFGIQADDDGDAGNSSSSSVISEHRLKFRSFYSLFIGNNGEGAAETPQLRPSVLEGMKTCCKKLSE